MIKLACGSKGRRGAMMMLRFLAYDQKDNGINSIKQSMKK